MSFVFYFNILEVNMTVRDSFLQRIRVYITNGLFSARVFELITNSTADIAVTLQIGTLFLHTPVLISFGILDEIRRILVVLFEHFRQL